jgi:predicted heme/steroid binding protein
MQVDERSFSLEELRRYDGTRGARKFVAFEGVVYDVTECPKWRPDLHEGLHFPGQDLSQEFPEAPHGREVFARPCVKRVGLLAPEGRSAYGQK